MGDVAHDDRNGEHEEPSMHGLPLKDVQYAHDIALLATASKG